jgi:hypothetical protein
MLVQFVVIVSLVLIMDWAAFWQVENWSRSFRGEGVPFTHRETLFPRLMVTILGCIVLLIAKQFSEERIGVVLFCVAMALIVSSHAYLYFKAYRMRRDDDREP